jgi:hypothetical protein
VKKQEFKPSVVAGFTQLREVLPSGKVVSTVRLTEEVKSIDLMLSMLPSRGRPYDSVAGSDDNFETMVFPTEDDWEELDAVRYSTAEEAREGHQKMVEKWSKI